MWSTRSKASLRTIMFGSLLAGTSLLGPQPDATAAACPPGPNKPPPAGCPAPTDKQCADTTSPYAPSKNGACAAAWNDHCSCVNQQQFDGARAPLATPGNMSRSPSPTKGVFPADQSKNDVHVNNYGINASWLSGTPPSPKGNKISTTIHGVPVSNVTDPTAALQIHRANPGKSKQFKPILKLSPKQLAKSKQHTWAAREMLARAEAIQLACPGKDGDALIACAKSYRRHLDANPPRLGSCEDFVYNRFYDIEQWMDQTNACHGDALCKAAITLDPTDGIAGKVVSGSDVDPSKRADLKKFFEAFAAPDCKSKKLSVDDIRLCQLIGSIPPVGHVQPTYWRPLSGGSTPVRYAAPDGTQVTIVLGGNPVGYWAPKNPFYDVLPLFTQIVTNAFGSDPAKMQSVNRLVAELNKGKEYFYVGKYFNGKPPNGAQQVSYDSEWAFQRAMHNATKNASMHTFRDFAKRRSYLEQREEAFSGMLSGAISQSIHFAIPASTVNAQLGAAASVGVNGSNLAVVQNSSVAPQTPGGAVANKMLSPRASRASVLAISQKPPTEIDKFAWNNGANPPKMDTTAKYPRLLCSELDKLMPGYSARRGGIAGMPAQLPVSPINGPPLNGGAPQPNRALYSDVGTAACNLINAVLDEWARADQPKALAPNDTTPAPASIGCFANDPACNWDPVTFAQGVDDLVHYQLQNVQAAQREADYKFCKAWQPVIANPPPPLTKAQFADMNNGEMLMLAEMKTAVTALYNSLPDVPVLDKGGQWKSPQNPGTPWANSLPKGPQLHDAFATFGEDRNNAEVWGNELFGVGYAYEIGWEIPTRWEQVAPNGEWKICDFGIGAHGGFEAYAFAFGSDKFDIIAADLVAGVHDYTNPTVPGAPADVDTNLHDAAFDAHLTIAGDSLVAENMTTPLNQSHTAPLAMGSNSWTLFTIPFQISFVTLEVSVGVGYSYEVDLTMTPTHDNTCHVGAQDNQGYWKAPAAPTLGLTSEIHPQGELDGIVDAYASLAGLAGVGVEVDLTLLGLGLPVSNTITLDSSNLSIDTSLNMDFHTLDGSLSVYAEALFFRLFDIEILSWDGIHHQVPLFNTSAKIGMPALNLLGGSGLKSPAKDMKEL